MVRWINLTMIRSLGSAIQPFILITVMVGCATNVHTVYDHKIDFNSYKTFCWMEGCGIGTIDNHWTSVINDSLLRKHIREGIEGEMKKKGFREDRDNPQMLVGYNIAFKDEKMMVYHRLPEDMPQFNPNGNQGEEITYLKGTLVVGIADMKTSSMIWESSAVSYLDLDPDLSEKQVLKGIRKVLFNFPPKE